MISENFEITCLKWLKHTCAPIKPIVTSENFIFSPSLIFVSGNLALKSKEVKCYQKWLKMGLNQGGTHEKIYGTYGGGGWVS